MDMGSKYKVIAFVLTCAVFCVTSWGVYAENVSTSPADLVNNDRVEYTLPDTGSITPESPLFVVKQMRDEVLLMLSQQPTARVRLMIQMSDRYTVYAQTMEKSMKPQKAAELFAYSFKLQQQLTTTLSTIKHEGDNESVFQELKSIALQSNIKQAETIRDLIDEVASDEQPNLIQHLNTNMLQRKKLQAL